MKVKKQLTIEEFNVLSVKNKKILVAEDVLAQIKLGKYIAESGTYLNLNFDTLSLNNDDDIKKNFDQIKSCEVCAIGSAVMSITKFANNLSIGDTYDIVSNTKVEKLLLSVFTEKELALMEACFEGEGCQNYTEHKDIYSLSEDERDICNEFYEDYSGKEEYYDDADSEKLLINIMKNIIKNGEFNPEIY